MLLSSSIFLATLFVIIWQPKNIQIGTAALIGAFFSLLFQCVSFSDIIEVTSIVWDATLAFLGIIIVSLILDEIGFFEWCAIKIAKISNQNTSKMFIFSLLLGSFVAAFFANDGAALILTPILLSKMKLLKFDTKTIIAFLLAGGFISDSSSLVFVFSNLTNIVTADYFSIGFIEYFSIMLIPFLTSTFISIVVLYFYFKNSFPKHFDASLLKEPSILHHNKKLFLFSWFFLFLLLLSYIIGDIYHFPISFFALGGAFLFLAITHHQKALQAKKILQKTPWQIIWFSIGLYIVVYGLKNGGLTHILTLFLEQFQDTPDILILITGFISGILSAIMNNLPTIMIMDIATQHIPNTYLPYANIIGANIGPKMTPFGSLATLLWLHILEQQGVKITFWQYTKFGLLITPFVLFIVLLSLLWS